MNTKLTQTRRWKFMKIRRFTPTSSNETLKLFLVVGCKYLLETLHICQHIGMDVRGV